MTRFRLFLALGATAFSLATATAHADEFFYHATICVPANSGDTSAVYNGIGVNNVSLTTPLVVECPLPTSLVSTTLHIHSVNVSYFDRGATRTTCTVRNMDFTGAPLYSATQTSPGFNNASQPFLFSPPANSGTTTANFWSLECTIPARNAGAYSALSAIYMTTAP